MLGKTIGASDTARVESAREASSWKVLKLLVSSEGLPDRAELSSSSASVIWRSLNAFPGDIAIIGLFTTSCKDVRACELEFSEGGAVLDLDEDGFTGETGVEGGCSVKNNSSALITTLLTSSEFRNESSS